MKHASVSPYQLLLSAFVAVALFALLGAMPARASALDIASQTQQILPLGANTCTPIQVSNFTPYIYDNALDSFEFTVSDTSYVAITGSVGQTSIPLRFITRRADSSGGVRIHVDINTTPLTGTVPVTMTLLSASAGHPLCASVIATNVGSGPVVIAPTPTPAPAQKPTPAPAPVKPLPPAPATGEMNTGTATATVPSTVTQSPVTGLCSSDASAYRLWLILLVLYAIVVGGLLWIEFPLSWAWARTPERVATAILALLVLLLAFWYISTACRAALWMPLVAFLIAVLGLLAAFWNHPKVTQMLLIEESKKPIPMPPAKK